MEKVKETLFIKCIIAEESLKHSLIVSGEGYETHLQRENYENLLDLIEKSGWYEEYRSFKIMAVLYFALRDQQDTKRLAGVIHES